MIRRLLERLGRRAVRAIGRVNEWVMARWNDGDPPDPVRHYPRNEQ